MVTYWCECPCCYSRGWATLGTYLWLSILHRVENKSKVRRLSSEDVPNFTYADKLDADGQIQKRLILTFVFKIINTLQCRY